MALQVQDILGDVYIALGNITRDQLDITIVLQQIRAELNKRDIELIVTEQNARLVQKDKQLINERDQLVSIDDFGTAVRVSFVDPFTNIETPVEMVNFNTLPDWETEGQLRCSIYGEPKRIRFSLNLNAYSNWTLRYWYEPKTEAAKGLRDEVKIDPQFRYLISFSVARRCYPYAEIPVDKKATIMEMLTNELGNQDIDGSLENLWYKQMNANLQYGNNRRRPFRAGAPRTARYSRT